jgi:hypothetical protein
VQTENGDITLTGEGTGSAGSRNNDGISVFNGGVVVATGSGNISLVGNAGVGGIDNQGIAIGSSDAGLLSRVAVSTGNITAVGTGNGTGSDPVFGNFGVWVFNGGVVEVTATGTIAIQGTGVNNNAGIVAAANAFQTGTSLISSGVGGTSLTLTADEIDLTNGRNVAGSGLFQLQPLTPALPILVGGSEDSGAGVLDVTTADLASVTDGFASITIGRDNGFGALTVAAAGVTFNDPVVLRSPGTGGSIIVNGPVQLDGNALTLTAGSTADINADLTAFGANITVTSDGTIDTTGSFLRSLSQTGPGGGITLVSGNNIDTGILDASSAAGTGGAITLTSAGNISTGGVVLGSEVFGLDGQPLTANAPGVVDFASGLTPNGADVIVGAITRPTNILLPNSVNMEGGDASLFVANDYTFTDELLGAGNILMDVEGILTLTGRMAATSAGNSIVLDTQGFVNNFAGEGQALDPGDGRFLAYSTRRPSVDDRGALDDVSDITRGTFAANLPESITPADENFFVYPDFGTLTFVASDRSIPYGDPVPFTNPPVLGVDYTVAFSEGSELPEDPFSGDPMLTTDANVDALDRVTSDVGGYALIIGVGSVESDFSLAFENGALTITPAPLRGSPVARREYGEANSTAIFDPESFSGLKLDDRIADLGTISFDTNANPASPVSGNPYSLIVTGFANGNYSVDGLTGAFLVTPAPLTIRANDASRFLGAANPPFTATFTGFKLEEGPQIVTGLQFRTPAEPSSQPGDYPIVPFGATAANYSISFASGTLTIEDIAPEDVPNSALTGNPIANLPVRATGTDGAGPDSATESTDAVGITGLNVVFETPQIGARAEDEDPVWSSGGNESFWGPPIPGEPGLP